MDEIQIVCYLVVGFIIGVVILYLYSRDEVVDRLDVGGLILVGTFLWPLIGPVILIHMGTGAIAKYLNNR